MSCRIVSATIACAATGLLAAGAEETRPSPKLCNQLV